MVNEWMVMLSKLTKISRCDGLKFAHFKTNWPDRLKQANQSTLRNAFKRARDLHERPDAPSNNKIMLFCAKPHAWQ